MSRLTAYEWAKQNRWDIPDTDFARVACETFAKIDTGLHNVYGQWATPANDHRLWGIADGTPVPDDLKHKFDHPCQPITIDDRRAVLWCTNTIGKRFTEALNATGLYYEIGTRQGFSYDDLSDVVAVPFENGVVTGDYDRAVFIVIDGAVYAERVYTQVAVWAKLP